MDELTKYRITGAVIWLALLIILVPSWYANPVDYEKAQPWLYSSSYESLSTEVTTTVKADKQRDVTASSPAEISEPSPDREKTPQTEVSSPAPSQQAEPALTPSTQEAPLAHTQDLVEPKSEAAPEVTLDEPMLAEETTEIKEPVPPSEDKSPAWLVRVASYSSIESANRTLGVLEMRYKVTIGDFSTKTQKIYSVRVGPFSSLQEAEKAKTELDKELVTNSVIVQIR